MNELSIPEKCQSCPQLLERQQYIDLLEEQVDEDIQMAVSDKVDQKCKEFFDFMQENVGEAPEGVNPEAMARNVRARSGERVEALNEEVATIQGWMAHHALNCMGPALIHEEIDRRTYDVAICRSPKMSDETTETVVVKRTRI